MFDIGAPQFGLRRAKIGTWVGDGTYTEVTNVPSVQVLESAVETINARLEGNDRITATAAVAIGGTVTLRFGSIDSRVLSVITGSDHESSGASPDEVSRLFVTAKHFPYVGLVGQAMAAEGGGSTTVFIPKMKCAEGFSIRMEYGQFSIPEITFDITPDDNFLDADSDPALFVPIMNETAATDVLLPPTEVL